MPVRAGVSETVSGPSPVRVSIVDTIGRPFKGTFVRGMMAMKMQVKIERVRGYPDEARMFPVTSFMTRSPNIRRPAIAIKKSRMYCKTV
jgi:hypothetical protein